MPEAGEAASPSTPALPPRLRGISRGSPIRPPSTPNLPKFANGFESELNGVRRRWLPDEDDVDCGTADDEFARDDESWERWIGGDGGVVYSLRRERPERGVSKVNFGPRRGQSREGFVDSPIPL